MKTLIFLVFPLFLFFQQESSCQDNKQNAETEEQVEMNDSEEQDMESVEANSSSSFSNCMEEKIQFFKEERSFMQTSKIFTFTSKGEKYYFFDEGMALDAPAYVLNESCDTVCVTGGMRRGPGAGELKECPQEDKDSRKILWEKK